MSYSTVIKGLLCAGIGISLLMGTRAYSAAPDAGTETLKGKAAYGDYTTDAPGVRRLITVDDLPQPAAAESVNNGPHMVARPADAIPQAPAGFTVELLAHQGISNCRKIVTAPNGDLFMMESTPGRLKVLRETVQGKLESTSLFADGLTLSFGIAFYPPGPNPEYVYVANTDSVIRFPYHAGDLKASGPPQTIVPQLPGGGRLRGGGHWTRDVVFSPDGKKMLVSVGSGSNVTDDPEGTEKERADVLEFNPDGTGRRVFASGIRNAVGLAIDPSTGILWGSVNERDEIGNNLPPDYITHIQAGGFYGWPWYYIGNHPDPRHLGKHPELADKVIVPDVLLQAHSASLCMTFYEGKQFPPDYLGQAFAAEHGSWNRNKRTGYKVIWLPMKDGKATGEYVDFLTGFVNKDGNVWGRPVGVTVDNSGALIVTDDGSNSVWRVTYPATK